MKNKISDLRDHMFAALERLNQEDLSEDDLKKEIERAKAVSEVGKVIVESAKTEVLYLKLQQRTGLNKPQEFVEDNAAKVFLERPKAEYSNTSTYGLSEQALNDKKIA
jgi:hypothetical protein